MGFPAGSVGKKICLQCRRHRQSWVQSPDWEGPLKEGMATHSSVLAWRILGQRRLLGCSPQGCKESEVTEARAHMSYSIVLKPLSCVMYLLVGSA